MAPGTWTGIGARATPADDLALLRAVAAALAAAGWTARSGGAEGADEAVIAGATSAGGAVEVFLPWPRFRGHRGATLARPSAAALDLAARHHPAWSACGASARALHARNSHEVLGARLDRPSRFVLCWTADGSTDGAGRSSGGTGQALRIAAACGVPVLNLRRPEHRRRVEVFLG
jgi:hypothetical protein